MSDDDMKDALDDIAKIWRSAHDAGLPTKFADWFRNKRSGTIVILGSTGSGKSNLIKSLDRSAELVDPISNNRRTQTAETHKVRIDDTPFRVVDTPGQDAHANQRKAAIREAFRSGEVRVINVVSYGYHEYSTADPALDENGYATQEYLSAHRQNERDRALEWLPLLGDADSTRWILTVVAKADLWWDNQAEVLNYYRDGPYAELIRSYDGKVKHVVMPYCSVIHRFFGDGRVAGTFDDSDRIDINLHLIEQLPKLG